MRLLFVCTGNICRSPLAERLAGSWAAESLGAGAAMVHIWSAGTEGLDGKAIHAKSAAALVELGGDPSGFASQPFRPQMATEADLVFTMTRKQRRSVLAVAPRALRRTFTLPEAADLLRQADLRGVTDQPIRVRAQELAARLNAVRAYRRTTETDDVFDPIGQSGSVHRQVADRIARKLRPLADVLFAEESPGRAWAPPQEQRVRPDLPPVPMPLR